MLEKIKKLLAFIRSTSNSLQERLFLRDEIRHRACFIAGPIALHFASWFLPENPSPFRRILTISTCTVLLMCPLMSLAATLYFKQELGSLPSVWLSTFLINLPMAFCWQMFIAGPAVRRTFRACFMRSPFLLNQPSKS